MIVHFIYTHDVFFLKWKPFFNSNTGLCIFCAALLKWANKFFIPSLIFDLNFNKYILNYILQVDTVDKSFSLLELRYGIPHPWTNLVGQREISLNFIEQSVGEYQVPRKEDPEVNKTSSLLLRNLRVLRRKGQTGGNPSIQKI